MNESSFLLVCNNFFICFKEIGCLAEATNHGARSFFPGSIVVGEWWMFFFPWELSGVSIVWDTCYGRVNVIMQERAVVIFVCG